MKDSISFSSVGSVSVIMMWWWVTKWWVAIYPEIESKCVMCLITDSEWYASDKLILNFNFNNRRRVVLRYMQQQKIF